MFFLLIVFLFTPGFEMAPELGQVRQVLQPKFEPTAEACRADAMKALTMEAPEGVIVGAKCDGPLVDPSVPKIKG